MRLSAVRAVRLVPPLPSTTAFLPAGSMPASRSMVVKPPMSVLWPSSEPSGRTTSVLTLPISRAVSLS